MHYMAWRFSFLVLYRNSFLDFEVLPDTQTIEIRPPERDPHNTIFKGFFFRWPQHTVKIHNHQFEAFVMSNLSQSLKLAAGWTGTAGWVLALFSPPCGLGAS